MKSVNNGKANAGRDLNLVLASDDHGLFQMLANALSRCHIMQDDISYGMTISIVDALEAVDVQHHHHPACCIRLSRLRIVQGQVLHETAPIVQASERTCRPIPASEKRNTSSTMPSISYRPGRQMCGPKLAGVRCRACISELPLP